MEQGVLYWHNYSDHLKEILYNLRKSQVLTDVTLVCDDRKQIKAHKIVLNACSTVFRNIIESLPESSPVIYLRGIQHQEIESILDFMYLGVATFYQERMDEFLNVAQNLGIKEISNGMGILDDRIVTSGKRDIEDPGFELNDILLNIKQNLGIKSNVMGVNDDRIVTSEKRDIQDPGFELNETLLNVKQVQNFAKDLEISDITWTKDINDSKVDVDMLRAELANTQSNDNNKSNIKVNQNLNMVKKLKMKGTEEEFSCHICNLKFSKRNTMKEHLASHLQNADGKFPCNLCGRQLSNMYQLQHHTDTQHDGLRYSCNICSYQATARGHLQQHLESVHQGIRYPCDQCDKKYSERRKLTKHIKITHEGMRYPCSLCAHKTKDLCDLVKHHKKVHPGMKYQTPRLESPTGEYFISVRGRPPGRKLAC